MGLTVQRFEFNNQTIDEVSDLVRDFCTQRDLPRKDALRLCLTIEECLLRWMENDVSPEFELALGSRLGKGTVQLRTDGEAFNPFEDDKSEYDVFAGSLLGNLGLAPTYSYRNKQNRITFHLKKKQMNQLLRLVLFIAVGALVGLLLSFTLSPAVNQGLLEGVIDPIYNMMFRLLGYISGPLIFLSVMWGIYGIGDAATLGKVGKKLVLRFLLLIFIIAAAGVFLFPLFGLSESSETVDASQFSAIFEMVLDLVPANIVAPFADGNTLQIIFTAVIFGVAMLFLESRVDVVANLIEQVNLVVQFLMEFISKLIPYFIFLIVVRLVISDTFSAMSSIWKLVVIFLVGTLVLCLVFTSVVAIRHKVSPLLVFRKSIPTLLITITTSSSVAAFESTMRITQRDFGVDNSLCSFGIPLGMVMFKTASTLYYLVICFYFSAQFGVGYSPAWLVTAGFMAAMLAIATPPIPGGGVISYTILFNQMGIPLDALAIALSVDVIFDIIITTANMYNLPLALLGTASSLGLLDEDALRKEATKKK